MKKEEKLRATDSNPYTTIRIPHEEHEERTEVRIWIPYIAIQIPETRVMKNKARRFESSSYGFKSLGKSKGRRLKVRESDSNLRVTDSNPSWLKIQISFRQLESPTQRFESLLLEFWKIRLGDSNLRVTDSNPLAKVKAEEWRSERTIRIFELRIRIPLGAKFKSHSGDSNPLHSYSNSSWRKIQISLRWFESPKQRFESLVLQKH